MSNFKAKNGVDVSLEITANNIDLTDAYPDMRPTLNLNFAKTKTLDKRITFTRASAASYVDDDGYIKTVGNNTPRFDHHPVTQECKGFLVENTSTNLLPYSEDFNNTAWSKSNATINTNVAMGPDGFMSADKLVDNSTNAQHSVYYSRNGSNETVTFSIFAKAGELSQVFLQLSNFVNATAQAAYDLTTGAVSQVNASNADYTGISASTVQYPNGWWRCILTATKGSVNTTNIPNICPISGGTIVYSGTGQGIYLWGAQLEVRGFPTSYIPSSLTFTSRASAGSYVNSSGLIASATTNTARYSYNPANLGLGSKLLLEDTSTNLLTYSEDFTNAAWVKFNNTITANATTAPDGTTTADKFVENTVASSSHGANQTQSFTSGQAYTISIFAKAGERTKIIFGYDSGTPFSAYQYGLFDLINGTASAFLGSPVLTITPYGNGWFRCTVTATATGTGTGTFAAQLHNGTSNIYTGDGTSGTYFWGGQLENLAYPTSYIATTTATVARSADVSSSASTTRSTDNAVINGSSYSSIVNPIEGTMFAIADSYKTSSYPAVASIDDTTVNNRYSLFMDPTVNSAGYFSRVNSYQTSNTISATINNTMHSYAAAFTNGDAAVSIDGGTAVTLGSTTGISATTNRFVIGDGDTPLDGHIKVLQYYPKRLSNSVLQNLTK